MKKILFVAAAAATFVSAAPALAQGAFDNTTFYGTLGYTQAAIDDLDVDLGAVSGRLGARFTPYVGAEAELGFGVKDEDIGAISVELDNHAAAYVVGFLPVQPNFDLFARVGYGTQELSVSGPGASASADGESVNYGVGAQFFFDANNGVRGDWTRHDFEDDGEADVFSISYVRKF
jgi:hypothetical protein